MSASAASSAFTTTVEQLMQLKMPFFAKLPSLLYVQDQVHQGHLHFKQARAVRILKEYWLQLRTDDFRELARCAPSVAAICIWCLKVTPESGAAATRSMDHFTSRVHHSIFLFVTTENQSRVRGFRLMHTLKLKEEFDTAVLSSAWAEFLHSEVVEHVVDERVQLQSFAHNDDAQQQLKTRVSVPSWSTLANYATTLTGCDDVDDGFTGDCLTDTHTPWQGFSCGGRLIYKGAFNVFSGCVDVPQLIPEVELAPHNLQSTELGGRQGGSTAPGTVMPAGWYRNNLIGARIHAIDMYR